VVRRERVGESSLSLAWVQDQSSTGTEERGRSATPWACTVVVSTRDRPDVLAGCLQAVWLQGYPGLDVVVVDSDPQCSDARAVARHFGAKYVRLAQPGLSRARNKGAAVATGDVIVFLDDDLQVEPGCIAALCDEFSDERTVAVSGRVLTSGGDGAARAAFEAFGGFDPGPERRAVDRESPDWFELANFGALGTGAMLAIRRAAFETWPGFDERLGRGGPQDCSEELYAYFTLVARGHRVVYSPRAIATHPAPASLDELRQRILNGAAGATAYLTLLLVEQPRYRGKVLRYALEALRGQRRQWRPRPTDARHAVVSRWRERLAWLRGPLLYLRMRLRVAATRLERLG
jgi:glycosyltransferase involved in cell wall biosynthesis